MRWIPVSEQMPEPEKPVLVVSQEARRRVWSRAVWIPRWHKLYESDYEGDDLDYKDDDDEAYWPADWYEWNNYEDIHWRIDGNVTHWMPIALPAEQE